MENSLVVLHLLASGRFDPPFSWEMPVPSREYDSCFLVSHLVMS
jgi:hypothetical protein